MGLFYRLGLLAAVIVLAAAGVVLLADWPVRLGEYSIQVCREVVEGGPSGGRVICEERRFSLLRGSPISGFLGAALLSLALDLIVVLAREYFVKRVEMLQVNRAGPELSESHASTPTALLALLRRPRGMCGERLAHSRLRLC